MSIIIGIIESIGKGRGSQAGGDFILTEDGCRISTEDLELLIQE